MPSPLRGNYRTIVADPPWPMGRPHGNRTKSTRGRWGPYLGKIATRLPYDTMTLGEIAALPLADLATPDAHLYLWTVNRFLEQTYDIAREWGFAPSTLLTWCKAPMGIGLGWAHGLTTEHILFCRRGSLPYKRSKSRLAPIWSCSRAAPAQAGTAGAMRRPARSSGRHEQTAGLCRG